MKWEKSHTLASRTYKCGHCGHSLASQEGFFAHNDVNPHLKEGFIYICHKCTKPTFFDKDGRQDPGHSFGEAVANIPDKTVSDIFDEARNCMKTNSYTGTVLCCRKLLMHVAVALGAKHGLNFIECVEFLGANGHIPKAALGWIDHVRKKGNEANHEIVIMKKEDAELILKFCSMLLRVTYEFPSEVPKN